MLNADSLYVQKPIIRYLLKDYVEPSQTTRCPGSDDTLNCPFPRVGTAVSYIGNWLRVYMCEPIPIYV